MVISQKVGAMEKYKLDFGIKLIKVESVCRTMTPKPHSAQNVTCSLFC